MEWASAKEMLREKEPTRETASAKAKAPRRRNCCRRGHRRADGSGIRSVKQDHSRTEHKEE